MQYSLFKKQDNESNMKYSSKIKAPVYEPSHLKPHIYELVNSSKTQRILNNIEKSNVPDEVKQFLRIAATRHNVFNYEKIADYYAHSDKEIQELFEQSALVIIDLEKAIELGYVDLCKDIKKEYLETYNEEPNF